MNEILKKQVNLLIEEEGIMAGHVAKKIGVSPSMFSYFRHGKRNLGRENANKLQEFLAKYPVREGQY